MKGFITTAELQDACLYSQIHKPSKWQMRQTVRIHMKLATGKNEPCLFEDDALTTAFQLAKEHFLTHLHQKKLG